MILAVNGRNAGCGLPPEAPQLHHVYLAGLVVPTRVPADYLLALGIYRYAFYR